MCFFSPWNTKGEILENVHGALFHTIIVCGNLGSISLKMHYNRIIQFNSINRISQ